MRKRAVSRWRHNGTYVKRSRNSSGHLKLNCGKLSCSLYEASEVIKLATTNWNRDGNSATSTLYSRRLRQHLNWHWNSHATPSTAARGGRAQTTTCRAYSCPSKRSDKTGR